MNFCLSFLPFKNLGLVHTYPDIFESATVSFWKRLPSRRIHAHSTTIPDIFKSALQSGKNKSATNSIMCGRVNPDILESDDVTKSCPVSSFLNNKPIWRHNSNNRANLPPLSRTLIMAHALKSFYCRGALMSVDRRIRFEYVVCRQGNF